MAFLVVKKTRANPLRLLVVTVLQQALIAHAARTAFSLPPSRKVTWKSRDGHVSTALFLHRIRIYRLKTAQILVDGYLWST